MGALLAALLVLGLVSYVAYRMWSGVALVLACIGFLCLAPVVFFIHVAPMSLDQEQSEKADLYIAMTAWLPIVASVVWLGCGMARRRGQSWPSMRGYLRDHVLLTQPTIGAFCGCAAAALLGVNVEKMMKSDESVLMSIFAMVVFLVCAWFLPHVLKPMLHLDGKREATSGMLANIIGLLLSLMVAIVAFKARETFAPMNSALNTMVEGVVAFLVAALCGAGALLAARKGQLGGAGGKEPRENPGGYSSPAKSCEPFWPVLGFENE